MHKCPKCFQETDSLPDCFDGHNKRQCKNCGWVWDIWCIMFVMVGKMPMRVRYDQLDDIKMVEGWKDKFKEATIGTWWKIDSETFIMKLEYNKS